MQSKIQPKNRPIGLSEVGKQLFIAWINLNSKFRANDNSGQDIWLHDFAEKFSVDVNVREYKISERESISGKEETFKFNDRLLDFGDVPF